MPRLRDILWFDLWRLVPSALRLPIQIVVFGAIVAWLAWLIWQRHWDLLISLLFFVLLLELMFVLMGLIVRWIIRKRRAARERRDRLPIEIMSQQRENA